MHGSPRTGHVPEGSSSYGPAHAVEFTPGGQLARAWSGKPGAEVNSLHSQGVDRLGEGLVVEARAADGLVEAFRVADAPGLRWRYSGIRNGR